MIEVRQYFLGCLAQASYLVVSGGVAAVVDPRRDVDMYQAEAAELGATIGYVIETHLHADFVSGHRELAVRTGAAIYVGARAGATFPHVAVRDGDNLAFGSGALRFIETPGHTPESICVVVVDRERGPAPCAVFTGDTLLVGDVGRPDLGGDDGARELAGMMYDSLHTKLLALPDDVTVYPAHGAGSLCGRAMRSERTSTIGEERRTNAALQAPTRAAFVAELTAELPERPRYFERSVEVNRNGARTLADLAPPAPLDPVALREARDRGAVVLDTRDAEAFGAGHIPGSVHVGLDGQYAAWAATVLGGDAEIVLVAADERSAEEARTRLTRVGIERVTGFLHDGFRTWAAAGQPLETVAQIDVDALYAGLLARDDFAVVDVRRPAERRAGYLRGSVHLPLDRLSAQLGSVDASRWAAVYCKGGYRSSNACSLMQRSGLRVMNVRGGFDAWLARKLPFTTAPETRNT